MPYYEFLWTDEIVKHIEAHNLSQDDYEHIVCNPYSKGFSRSSGLPVAWGYATDGRYFMAVYQQLDEISILPVTAYEVSEPR